MLKLTRHARNNMRLYEIHMEDLLSVINTPDVIEMEVDTVTVIKRFQNKFSGYPIKVVYKKQKDDISVITTYPLKKKYRR